MLDAINVARVAGKKNLTGRTKQAGSGVIT